MFKKIEAQAKNGFLIKQNMYNGKASGPSDIVSKMLRHHWTGAVNK